MVLCIKLIVKVLSNKDDVRKRTKISLYLTSSLFDRTLIMFD